jgi:hypothetical protein
VVVVGFLGTLVSTLVPELVSWIPFLIRLASLIFFTIGLFAWVARFYGAWIMANLKRAREYTATYEAWETLHAEALQLHGQYTDHIQSDIDKIADLRLQLDRLIEQRIEREEQIAGQLHSWSLVFRELLSGAEYARFIVVVPEGRPPGLAIKEVDLPGATKDKLILILNPITFKLLGLFTVSARDVGYFIALQREIFDPDWWSHAIQQARVQVNDDSQAVAVMLLPR